MTPQVHPLVPRRTGQSRSDRVRYPGSLRLILMLMLASSFIVDYPASNLAAQDPTPSATSPTLVGVWQWNSFAEVGDVCCGPEPSTFAIFHADGTYTEWQPVAGASIGIWRMTDERTAELVFVFPDTDPTLEGFAPGTATFTTTIEIDESGDAFVATGTIDVRDAGGVQMATVPWSRPAVRMTFESNPATGSIPATPVAATPGS